MTEPADHEALFLAHLPYIDRTVAAVARTLGIRGDAAEEFGVWAKERLWEHDYAILRKWRGESRITTYLAVVLANLGREFRVQRWGRWRPSAAARRLGPVAVRLETLVHRDGMRLDEAAELLRTRHETAMSDRELATLLAALPARPRPRAVDDGGVRVEHVPDPAAADDPLLEGENDAERDAAHAALQAALARLPDEERVVIRMHYLDGRTLADVSRALGVPQKPLYRLKDGALRTMRATLVERGMTADRLRGLLGGALRDPAGPYDGGPDDAFAPARAVPSGALPGKSGSARPSNESCDPTRADAVGAPLPRRSGRDHE